MNAIIVISAADNVATALEPLSPGTVLNGAASLTVRDAIPRGHKIALRPIAAGSSVMKYGSPIGVAIADIPAGAQLFRYYEMQIPLERPKLPNVEAWYARLKDRPAYREHVMVSFQDLKGR